MIDTILNGLLPVAFVITLGWLSAKLGMLKHDDAGVLATLVIRFALPFALFYAAVTTPADKIINAGLALCLTFGLMSSYLIALALGALAFKHTRVKAYRLDKNSIADAIRDQPPLAGALEVLAECGQAALRGDAVAREDDKQGHSEMFLARLQNLIHLLQSREYL